MDFHHYSFIDAKKSTNAQIFFFKTKKKKKKIPLLEVRWQRFETTTSKWSKLRKTDNELLK